MWMRRQQHEAQGKGEDYGEEDNGEEEGCAQEEISSLF
jgi:hypothetical protein